MAGVPDCPICGKPLDGPHLMDCHWQGLSRESATVRLIPPARLRPDERGYICDTCGKDGYALPCPACDLIWAAIDYDKPAPVGGGDGGR